PPPAVDVLEIPRVDYLLQNGGLSQPVTRHFLSVLPIQNGSSRPSNSPLTGAETLFTPFVGLLDQYQTVLSKQGSVAVATGHRSVARRLLDRLENVFSRDLPPHGCSCIICEKSNEPHRGLNWGDVLEWVSGRIELPSWPPFDLADIGTKAAEISGETPRRPDSPIQLDPDIAEEFREHYLRQSKKVRSAVDKWLHSTGETPVPPPQEVDDETLSFAILTNLDSEDRPYFNALLAGSKELRPATRAPTPLNRPRNDFIVKTGLSLQRLYRLQQVPRDAESATYLIKNHHTHDLLITLSNINNQEWEILTSGRFDGFLWSGADGDDFGGVESRGPTPFRGPSAMGSRTNTPFSPYSRGATPASFISLTSSGMGGSRPPVSNDEEMEMAAIAEIEREIYQGMEALEDAFEKLHHQAETVRTALRQRGAGLMQNLQNRRRIDVLSIPGSGNSQNSGYERPAWAGSDAENASDEDWQMEEYDLYPDDSASNISSSRHRRPKRRVERRTPAPIEEEEE
ncbi:5-methylcytosine g t mismatch-specific dna glycosylase, partial [Trichoderma arundinaceum]